MSNQGVDWAASRNIDTGWDGYSLERAALSFSKPTAQQIPLSDLANPTEFPQELLRLIVTAIWIARNNPAAIKTILSTKGKTTIC